MRILRVDKNGTLTIAADNYELETVKKVVVSGGKKDKVFDERVIRWTQRKEVKE